MSGDLSKRKNQVPNEGIGSIPETNYSPSRLVIHDHAADKAGDHFDIRFDIGNKAISFATKKGLPTESGAPIQLFRQPDHVISYMDWEGDIPKGEYGAGKVTKAIDTSIVLKASNDKIQFTIPSGDKKGTYSLFKTDEKNWMVVKKKGLEHSWSERPKYKELDNSPADEHKYFASEKIDGAHFIAKINPTGISFTSQRKSVTGDYLHKEDNVPHLRDSKVPSKYHGLVIRGELWHDKGFNTLSGIMNSKPVRAVETQNDKGWVRFAPFRIAEGPHGEQNLPYKEQYAILKELSTNLPHYFEVPRAAEKGAKHLFDEIGKRKGEGVVLVSEAGESYKLKHRYDYDLKIKGFTTGLGKYKDNAIGAVQLADKTGQDVGNVGTGLTDELRRDMFRNPDKYIGKLIKVESRKPLKGKLREPSFLGMTTDKNEADEVI